MLRLVDLQRLTLTHGLPVWKEFAWFRNGLLTACRKGKSASTGSKEMTVEENALTFWDCKIVSRNFIAMR